MNNKNYKLYLTLLFCTFFLGNQISAQHYYTIDEGEFLMISNKGDLKLSTVFPGEGLFATQIGYSPIEHLSVTGTFVREKSTRPQFGFNGPFDAVTKGLNANIAVGGYYFVKTKKKDNKTFYLSEKVTLQEGFLFDIYSGYSIGSIDNSYYQNAQSYFDVSKFYLQVGVHWVFRIGSLSYGLRGVRLDYSNGTANGGLEEQELRDLFDGGIQDNAPFSFMESSFRYQIGIRQARIYTGITTKFGKEGQRPNDQKRTIITAGLIFELDEIFNKKNKTSDIEVD